MYDATGALKIKTLGGGMAGAAAVNSRSYIDHIIHKYREEPVSTETRYSRRRWWI